jgi:flavin reductase (DIM6/NTAB) family NADH-FMN oxidoreductase RutF
MVASWVTQASLNPLGVAIAVAKDRAMVSFLQPSDTFVLNVLAEDNYQKLMKHFLKRFFRCQSF